jgi:hypothetical protein
MNLLSISLVLLILGVWLFGATTTLLSARNEAGPKRFLLLVSHIVPTPVWLWTFTSPAYSWLAAMLGMLLVLKEKIAQKKQKVS